MKSYTAFVPSHFGEGSFENLSSIAADLLIQKALIVCDGALEQIGRHAVELLEGVGIHSFMFTDVRPEPTDESIMKGVTSAKAEGEIDGIIGIGGGSSLDTAKCINVMLNNGGTLRDYASIGGNQPTQKGFPLILIPTTAGTGAECTFSSIFTCIGTGQKMSIRKPNCTLARAAIIDPVLTMTMPASLTLASGVDALCHAIEAYTVSNTNPVSDALAKEAIRLAYQYLPSAVKQGQDNPAARARMSEASTLAGMAFSNTLLHLVHAIGHSFGAVLHRPHGLMVGQALPYVVYYIADACPERVQVIGELLGLEFREDSGVKEIAKRTALRLYDFYDDIKFPSLRDLGFSLDQTMEALPLVERDGCFALSPKTMSQAQISEAIRNIYDFTIPV